MNIHKEGQKITKGYLLIVLIINVLFQFILEVSPWISGAALVLSIIGLIPILIFFRNPVRNIANLDNNLVYAPCDGKVVAIEEVEEPEYFKDKRIQVSIFMSPLNVHVNRNPISGSVQYSKYHEGKYLVAWHPKSSTENERTTIVLKDGKNEVLFRQIAGAVARRIINYLETGQTVHQGADMGFIRFGSRVDLFLPLDAKINVKINDIAKGNKTVIAQFQ